MERIIEGQKESRDHDKDLILEVIQVKRLDRLTKISLVCERKIFHVFSVYVPQQGNSDARKRGSFLKNSQIIYMMSLRRIF